MKKTIAVICITFYVITLAKPFLPFLAYDLNKQYIASNLCVNASKPEMHCDGKCYLNKQIQQNSKPDQNNATENNNKLPAFQNITDHLISGLTITPQNKSILVIPDPETLSSYHFNYSVFVFEPPKV